MNNFGTGATVVNLSTVYRHLHRDQRAAAAAADGFTRVESWWDFASANVAEGEVAGFLASLSAAGVELVALNSHGGNREHGERGIASLPDRGSEFTDSLHAVAAVARVTSLRWCNVAAGNRIPTVDRSEQLEIAASRYHEAVAILGAVGVTPLIEPLSTPNGPASLFTSGSDVVQFLDQYGLEQVGLLFDTFHLATHGLDVVATWDELGPAVQHIQLADAPGRGAPGTGDINFDRFLAKVRDSSYAGLVSLEYMPATGTTGAQKEQPHARNH